ncbi:MAG: RDD family protein [Actinobacteria bacterium]|nr:RDD family protein [Actinomycetota bacterium]
MAGPNPNDEKNQGLVVARAGRRFLAITIDWLMSWAVGSIFFEQNQGRPFWIALVFFLQIFILTSTTGASAGQRLLKLRVLRYPELEPLGIGATLLRTLLILLVIPAVVYDNEGRGLHDRIVSSAVMQAKR